MKTNQQIQCDPQECYELQSEIKRLNTFIDHIKCAVLYETHDRKIQYVNQIFCDYFEIPVDPKHLIGTDCSNAAENSKFLFEDPDEFVNQINKILKEKKPVQNEELILTDGRVFERDYLPIFINEEYEGHFWVYRDITEQHAMYEKMKKFKTHLEKILLDRELKLYHFTENIANEQEAREKLFENLNHKIRTPLHAISNFASMALLKRDSLSKEKIISYFETILDSSTQLFHTVEGKLDIDDYENQKKELRFQSVSAKDLTQEVLLSLTSFFNIKKIKVSQEHSENPLTIKGDRHMLENILYNILMHTIVFTAEGSRINIKTTKQNNMTKLIMKNEKCTADEKEIETMKNILSGAAKGKKNHHEFGSGFYIAKQMTDKHQGQIDFLLSNHQMRLTLMFPSE